MQQLTPAQTEQLGRNGFVVLPSAAYTSMTDAYQAIRQRELPVFVTTDALLHTAHLFFDYLLRAVELTTLRPHLIALTQSLLVAAARDTAQATDASVKTAARHNLAFFSVGARLLEPGRETPAEVEDAVAAELKLVLEHAGQVPPPLSPVLGIREDYSQYIPRGHYTRNDAFRSLFLAMMWYGRLGFFVYPSESHSLSPADNERLARQALLITRGLHRQQIDGRPAIETWRAIYETTALFAGRAEDPGPDEYLPLAHQVWGDLPDLDQLSDEAAIQIFLDRARQLARPRVLSTFYLSPDKVTPRWQDGTLGFHFLSQRFVPDSHILNDLVWDRVGAFTGEGTPFTLFVSLYEGPYRGVPRGLDVLAAFGSSLAQAILAEEGDAAYEGYAEKLTELQALYGRDEPGGDLYHRWLHVLRALLDAAPAEAPSFMQNQAWARKQLNGALGSWAELRHDTILYIKQSYTSVARGLWTPPPPQAYLEPCPRVYRRLGQMVTEMQTRLDEWRVLEPAVRDKVEALGALLAELAGVAERELAGQWPTEQEAALLQSIDRNLASLLEFPPDLLAQIASSTDDRMALVADVHTHLEGGIVLEEAVGDPFLICAQVDPGAGGQRYWGAVFSYYEFKHPMDDRLTDEAWQAMSPKPPLPAWTRAFCPAP